MQMEFSTSSQIVWRGEIHGPNSPEERWEVCLGGKKEGAQFHGAYLSSQPIDVAPFKLLKCSSLLQI